MECDISSYHVQSFNYLAEEGVRLAALDVPPIKFTVGGNDHIELAYTNAVLGKAVLGGKDVDRTPVYPSECRMRGITYSGPLEVSLKVSVNGIYLYEQNLFAGSVPIMLRSKCCRLHGLSEKQLYARNEEPVEKGGYFIVKGNERVIRLLVCNRSNYPFAIERPSYKKKGKFFTQYGCMMRSVRGMHSAVINVLHYLDISTMVLSLQYRREIFYVPFIYIIHALVDLNALQIFEAARHGRPNDKFFEACLKNMLRNAKAENVYNKATALQVLGSKFRAALGDALAPWEPDEEAAIFILRRCLCIHLTDDMDKFYCLVYMAQKLMALVQQEILSENLDNPQFQEVSVSGHILLCIIRERLENMLVMTKKKIVFMHQKKPSTVGFGERTVIQAWGTQRNGEITSGLQYFLATGTLVSRTGAGLMQNTGFSVIAERINQVRFISHFRAIHRGAFFMEMRTTDARKLRPEAWGFICPVHTPDGAPCGLLNHVTASTEVVCSYTIDPKKIVKTVYGLGVIPHDVAHMIKMSDVYPVLVDGIYIGFVPKDSAQRILQQLRVMKVSPTDERVPVSAELTLIRHSTDPLNVITQFPGLYVFTNPGRMIRPVKNLAMDQVEYIGTFEQTYLSIIIDPCDFEPGVTQHQELHPSALFSYTGNLIPFPDHNQSPRNVYQCQMSKQTMGVPLHSWHARADHKMYRLQFPQSPLLKPEAYEMYKTDDYPLGTNACVAVISYTGYDMEDAMVINKSSYERGFAHGTVIKVEHVDLNERQRFFDKDTIKIFGRDENDKDMAKFVDRDGLPYQGRFYRTDDPFVSFYDKETKKFGVMKYKNSEPAFCGYVRITQPENPQALMSRALIQWRISRNPIIGDKFASRHGQKGINSFLWPQESLPFSESGMVPDIIFNPHGFPSRMTIGMMIESMAAKAAASHGAFYDASPFVFDEKQPAIDYFGELLSKAGYSYYGEETFYSGVDGREMQAQIFFGIVYYQRLRHMIADKFQVRATGPVDATTLQPVKGRKKGGGVRFGEMERDSLIAHGTAFCLQDRLLLSSDIDSCFACKRCASIISVGTVSGGGRSVVAGGEQCRVCKSTRHVFRIQVPRVFRYLVSELASMNIRVTTTIKAK